MKKSVIYTMLAAVAAVGLVQFNRHNFQLSLIMAIIGLLTTVSYAVMSERLKSVEGWAEATSWMVQLVVFALHVSLFVLLLLIGIDSSFFDMVPLMVLAFGGASLVFATVLDRPQDKVAIEAVRAE